MNRIIKASTCMLLTATLSVATFITANAAATNKKNNTGNSVEYGDAINLSLNRYTHEIFTGRNYKGNGVKFTSKHKVGVDDDEAYVKPSNKLTKYNLVYWYAEWKDKDGKGKIKDSYEEWMSLDNDEYYSRELSDDMGSWTWDRDITYCRYDIYPLRNTSFFDEEDGSWDGPMYGTYSSIDKDEFNTLKGKCKRRASTDITH